MSTGTMVVTAAGVDTWSPAWYVDPDTRLARRLEALCTIAGKRGSSYSEDDVLGHRMGYFPSGLLFLEGHPRQDGSLCPPVDLAGRALALVMELDARGIYVRRESARPVGSTSTKKDWTMGPGFAGFRRVDSTVNFDADRRSVGIAALAGIAAVVRDSPGKADVWFGPDRCVESVFLRGHAGKRVLGRWYDKGLESGSAPRGRTIRGEDQRRWPKSERRQLEELTPTALRASFRRRFYPLWQATKGVTVGGAVVLAEKVIELEHAGVISEREAEALAGHMLLSVAAGRTGAGLSKSTMYRRERRMRELGLSLADGVMEEVEVNVADVLEQALETDAWERRG